MSENIQSISQGTYTIGQTSATNFIAGPGVRIDEPSAGTVRIGNDETVLFSGNFATKSCTLSESPLNFESVKFYLVDDGGHTSWGSTEIKSNLLNNCSAENGKCIAGCAVPWNEGFRIMTVSATSANDYRNWASCGYQWWGNGGGQIGTGYLNILKVVGINRISGSNT